MRRWIPPRRYKSYPVMPLAIQIPRRRSLTMANSTRTAGLLAVAALAVIAGARTISSPDAGYEIKTDEPVVVITDPGEFVVEAESQTDLEALDNDSREKRQAAVVPTWRCTGTFSGNGNSYDVDCNTNLEVLSTVCTLDGATYNCGGLDFSVDTTSFNQGEEHVLQIRVTARYGSSQGTLRYTFRFRKQTTSYTVTCSSRQVGENLVITCTGIGITRIDYNLNGGSYINSGSTSSFTILGSQLREGTNVIGLRITVNGVIRTTSLSAQKTRVVVFRPSCSLSYDNSGSAVFRCSQESGSEATHSITYTINGGSQRTVSSVSQFQINTDDLQVGNNIISLTFTSASGATVTTVFTVRKTLVQTTFAPSCSIASGSGGDVVFRCSQGSSSDRIQTIRYSINGGQERTTSSVSRFQLETDNLVVGSNSIRVTFVSSSGATRTISYTVRITQSQARSFSVRCGASYNDNHNADVACSTQTAQSEAIATIYYTINGGARQTAGSTTGFQVDKSLLTREVNSIVVTLVSSGGFTKDLTLNLVQPLSLRCNSRTTSSGITISCETNRQTSTISVVCYLDGVRQSSCNLNTELNFSQVSQGRHNYEVVVTDASGLTVRNQISFKNRLTTRCRGSLNLGASVYSVVCDSDRTLQYRCFIDGRQVSCPNNLKIDISQLQAGSHTLLLIGTDSTGNTATSTSNFTIPRQVGSCVIDDDAFDGVIDWTCTTNIAGVSIVCLVDNIQLEPCLCQLSSEFFTGRYSQGDHNVSLILTGRDGSSKRFDQVFSVQPLVTSSSHAIEPLVFECISEPNDEYVDIDCEANKPIDITCYLDDVLHTPCRLTNNQIAFANISQGRHTFAVVARDGDGLVDRSEVHFEEDLDISCRGSYNPGYDVVHLACDSTRPLTDTQCQLGDGASTQCPTPFDLPVERFVDDLTLRVSAHDNVGNTDTDELQFLTSSCEGC